MFFSRLLELDTELLIQARSVTSPDMAPFLRIFGESIVLFWAILLLYLWFFGHYKKDDTYKINALKIFFTIWFVFFFYAIVNFCIPQWRPNPQDVVNGIQALIPHPLDNSFPSGHALFSGAIIVGIYRYIPRRDILIIAIILALVTTLSRVLAGIHYPWDILGGFILGWLGGVFVQYIVNSKAMEMYIYKWILIVARWIKL
jgi:membrane-associated phospholipid phosphatase